MTNLYELTRKLVARGCPEVVALSWETQCVSRPCFVLAGGDGETYAECEDSIARDIWTMHGLRWYATVAEAPKPLSLEEYEKLFRVTSAVGQPTATAAGIARRHAPTLEAIEAATRHLEP